MEDVLDRGEGLAQDVGMVGDWADEEHEAVHEHLEDRVVCEQDETGVSSFQGE